jgi:hypothetical protein
MADQYIDLLFPTFYTNSVSLGSGPFDFSMLVMERLDETTCTVRARVVMTPAHAKLLLAALVEQVAKHEIRYGTIQLPTPIAKASSTEPEPPPSQSPNASEE